MENKNNDLVFEKSEDVLAPPPKKIDYRNELIFYFFNNMLETIVDSWESLGDIETDDSIPSAHRSRADPKECVGSFEMDEEIEGESDALLSKYSFLKTLEQIEETQKKRKLSVSEVKVRQSRKSLIHKRSKSFRKRSLLSRENTINETNNNIPKSPPDIWMIEPVAENVIITFKNGNIYEGPVFGKLMHGFGKFIWANGTKYEGMFENGTMTGAGELIRPEISHYSGGFLNGYRHGQGVMTVAEGDSVYHGGWRAGVKHGRGWQLFQPNEWYDGEWYEDAMSGSGIRQYASGARYQGFWKNGKRDGKGCAVMKNNDYYNGDWFQGKRSGNGEYIWNAFYNKTLSVPVQNTYKGAWDKNHMHGLGVMIFGSQSGTRYVGCYNKNEKHGAGIVLCENGVTIQSNPLFDCDKPVHLTSSGSIQSINEDILHLMDTTESTVTSAATTGTSSSSATALHFIRSTLDFSPKYIYLPTSNLDNATIANIELCKLAFPKIEENYISMDIPVNTPCEKIILDHYLNKVEEYICFSNLNLNDSNTESTKNQSVPPLHCSPESARNRILSNSARENMQNTLKIDQRVFEEKILRKAITTHLEKLRAIYKQYTRVACLKKVSFQTLLIRLFLWQFYRDCKIPHKGLSLINIDFIMSENTDTVLESKHNPFEIIYFWQFLHSLIAVALRLYGKECSSYVNEGILKTCFVRLLAEDVYPNYGHHTGCVLFDYVDVLPLKAAYKWFQEFKEPFTVLDFLRNACTIKNCQPPTCYAKHYMPKNISLQMGINAYAVGRNITYLQDELPYIQTVPMEKEITINDNEIYKRLFCFRKLGAHTVLSILADICPTVKENKDILNLEYELTFIEFYEAVLQCTQKIITLEDERRLKEKLLEQERSMEEENITSSTVSFNIKGSRIKRKTTRRSNMRSKID